MPDGNANTIDAPQARRGTRRARQPAPESFDPRRGPGGIDVAQDEPEAAPLPSGGSGSPSTRQACSAVIRARSMTLSTLVEEPAIMAGESTRIWAW